MPDKFELARGFFLKAESDLNTAQRMAESDGPYDTACFHAQQPAEKYLKGLLAFQGEPFPRTHNLEELQRLGEALPAWPLAALDLTQLSSYAVEVRYDFEFWPDRQTAQEAIGLASEVRRLVLGSVPAGARP
jgi:HEPN domain-containing protein